MTKQMGISYFSSPFFGKSAAQFLSSGRDNKVSSPWAVVSDCKLSQVKTTSQRTTPVVHLCLAPVGEILSEGHYWTEGDGANIRPSVELVSWVTAVSRWWHHGLAKQMYLNYWIHTSVFISGSSNLTYKKYVQMSCGSLEFSPQKLSVPMTLAPSGISGQCLWISLRGPHLWLPPVGKSMLGQF